MKVTIVLALVTSGLSQLGLTQVAELTYTAAGVAASTYGGRSIADALSRECARAMPSHASHASSSVTTLS